MGYDEKMAEIEVLESIFPEEFTCLSTDEDNISFSLRFVSQDSASSVDLLFFLPRGYPETDPPEFEVEIKGALSGSTAALKKFIAAKISELAGDMMIFSLGSEAKEWFDDAIERANKQAVILTLAEHKQHELNQLRRIGKAVTRESFLSWRADFEREMAAKEQMDLLSLTSAGKTSSTTVLTGKQLFEQNKHFADEPLDDLPEEDPWH